MNATFETENGSYILFALGGKQFALAVEKVISIVELVEIVDIPNSPKLLKGIISVRDEVVPVLDIQFKFGQVPSKITPETCLVIIDFINNDSDFEAAIQVDNVFEVVELKLSDFRPIPQLKQVNTKDAVVTNLVTYNDKVYLLIDLDSLFDNDEIFEIDSFVQSLDI